MPSRLRVCLKAKVRSWARSRRVYIKQHKRTVAPETASPVLSVAAEASQEPLLRVNSINSAHLITLEPVSPCLHPPHLSCC